MPLPRTYIVRHGATPWTVLGRHTGRTDVPLTPEGEEAATVTGRRLREVAFSQVFTSPSLRARRTCELAGFGDAAVVDEDLAEWDYGQYEGLTRAQILDLHPNWRVFRDGCPGGESPAQVSARADRVIARLRAVPGSTLVFSSGHFLRALTARWLGMEVSASGLFMLSTATLGILGYDHDLSEPALHLWNAHASSTALPPLE